VTGEAPSLDLVMFQRETGIGLTKGQGQGGMLSEPERRAAGAAVTAAAAR